MTDYDKATIEDLGWPLTKVYPYVRASDVTIEEETYENDSDDGSHTVTVRYWEARIVGNSFDHDGTFVSKNGPVVEMSRYGKTADEAYGNLAVALEEQGWILR